MALLFVDAGNSSIKYAVQQDKKITYYNCTSLDQFYVGVSSFNTVFEVMIYSSVLNKIVTENFVDSISSLFHKSIRLKKMVKNIFDSEYKYSDLGEDRLAVIMYVNSLKLATYKIIIDSGTAITVDHIDKNNKFLGGYICSGFDLEFMALNSGTDRLLKGGAVDVSKVKLPVNTKEAVQQGVSKVKLYGIKTVIFNDLKEHKQKISNVKIFITGGKGKIFQEVFKTAEYVDHMVLKGLVVSYDQFCMK